MKPSNETIAAALALPLKARQALVKAEGPGWRVHGSGHAFYPGEAGPGCPRRPQAGLAPPAAGGAWLPASEAEILRVWGGGWWLDDEACGSETLPKDVDHGGTYDCRLRAAIQCCPVGRFT